MHCWVSFSGFAEVYFEFCSEVNDNMQWMKTFVNKHSTGIPISFVNCAITLYYNGIIINNYCSVYK